ncbi:MAG: GDP-mannose 4,6-dehydratase [Pirellulaceae bacterium]|nr:MAG: GDP-mannose 4,6-dehydratase [Pirellulaceae bacterium]
MARRALVTGATGQDGVYLAHRLLACGYQVAGASRRPTPERLARLGPIHRRLYWLHYDGSSVASWAELLKKAEPHEIYHLAGPSFVPDSLDDPVSAAEQLAMPVVHLLEAVRRYCPQARVWIAGSSEVFGAVEQSPQSESTPFRPRNPYGVSKVFAHGMVSFYRRHYGLFACFGILYNHESPRRGERFVTRKISLGAARIRAGLQDRLVLGNLDARRDWGFAGDYVRAMHQMLLAAEPLDLVIATGKQHSVRDFCKIAFDYVGLDYRHYVVSDPALVRPDDSALLCGDASLAKIRLGWEPRISFDELVRLMVRCDLDRLQRSCGC